jgi:NAD(P)-dependent dehydrogenase (short-subunit alcohol dehydrogenase family)
MRVDLDAPIGAEWMSARKALVTGGGGRETGPGTVGWAISRLLARHGAAVAVLDRNPAAAHRTVSQIISAGGTAVPVIADVTSDEDCARAVGEARQRLGGLDTLVNNVAAWSPAELFDVEPDQFDELITLNLKTAWLLTRHAIEVIPAGGAIVNITSVAGEAYTTNHVHYAASKAGMIALTRDLGYEMAPHGVRINGVSPSAVLSRMNQEGLAPATRESLEKAIPLGRWGVPGDIGDAVVFLASARASFIVGENLPVAGGSDLCIIPQS